MRRTIKFVVLAIVALIVALCVGPGLSG